MRKELLLATSNPGKREELRALLLPLSVDLVEPRSLDLAIVVEEGEAGYVANASLKARAYAAASGRWSLADDSGLEVDLLNGAPGPRSARLAGADASDLDRRRALLEQLEAHPRPWKARFRCVAALSDPGGSVDVAEGICPGEVIPEQRGEGGFGYDPIFLVEGLGRTMAELDLEEKNEVSHRAQAVRALLTILRRRMGIGGQGKVGGSN
jgi:XTP/dITP diphosphohydrolase